MAETREQSAGAYPDSPLTARLTRRASEPLGVIDVRHPERLGTRGTAWMGQRLEMLDRWKTRYGLTAPEAPAEPTPGPAPHSFVMRAALPRTETVADSLAPAQFRVKRMDEVRSATPAKGAIAEAAGSMANDAPLALRAPEIAATYVGDSAAAAFRQRGGDSEYQLDASPTAGTSRQPAEADLPLPARGSQAAAPSAASVSAAAPGPPSATPGTPVKAQQPALVLRRKVSEVSLPTARAAATQTAPSGLPIAQSKPATFLQHSMPLVQGRTAAASSSALIPPSRAMADAEGLPPNSPLPKPGPPPSPGLTAPEIPTVRSAVRSAVRSTVRSTVGSAMGGAAPIVWRRADSDGSSRALTPPMSSAPNVQIMRSPSGGSSTQSLPAAPANFPAPRTSSGGTHAEHLAGQVSRIIARQLTVERERRGLAR